MAPQLSSHPGPLSSLWGHDSPLSDILNVRGFLTPPQNPNAPSASQLTASVPELRFSTRVSWTCRDARWAWVDTHWCRLAQILWMSKGENLKENRLVVIAKQPQEKVSEWVSPFGSLLGFDMCTKQSCRWCTQLCKQMWGFQYPKVALDGMPADICAQMPHNWQVLLCKCKCCISSEILLSLSQDPSPSARRPRQLSH